MTRKTHADIKWIKIATNIFSDEKILLIEQMPDADTILVIWFKLLCMAGKENNCGVFVMGNKIAYTDEMLSTIFRRPLPTIRLALSTFEAFGMIEIIENSSGMEVYTIPNWEKHQNIDGMEKIREQTRLRVAKHRENQKLALQCNVTVTEGNATEEEEEEEKEEDKKKKKKKSKKHISAKYVSDDDLNNAILSFLEFREKIKKPMTERAIQLLIKKLNKLAPDINTQIEIINQSILNGWQGIFPLNQQASKEKIPSWMNKKSFSSGMMQQDYNIEELEKELLGETYKEKSSLQNNTEFLKQKQAAEERIKNICSQ